MAGIFDYKRYINIFATTQDIKQTFPRDQYSLVWDIDGLGSDGWVCDVDWMTLVVDRIKFVNGEPNFDGSNVIGYFPGSTASVIQTGTTIILPANMYTGQMYPGQDINVPITMVNIKWTKDSRDFQRQLMLIQNWEPGTEIGNPENDPNYTPIVDSFPITVDFSIDPTTTFTDTTITVVGTATSNQVFSIANTVSTLLITPQFSDIPNALLTTTNFVDGEFTATFYVGNNWIETEPRQDGIYTILTSTLTTSSYSIVADITRTHDLYLQWQYDKSTGYRAGKTPFKTLTVTTTRSVTYVGQPLRLSLTANTVNQRSGDTSIFTVSHDKVNETDIAGLLSVDGFFTPSGSTTAQPISLGTGTFNTNGVFTITQVLATGTYVLQASYGGNIGFDIFKPMYLSTVSNTITHYVAEGREFTLTEMLIQEGPDYDYLYAHAIDDGRTAGEIGGLVTFYHNGNEIGTSTFVRHVYEWPVPGEITTSSYTLATAGTYPWPKSPAIIGKIWGGAFGNPQWQNDYPYQANSNPEWYRPSNPEYPTFFATFKYNSMELDWPPTRTKINTLGIVGDDTPSLPFNINIQISPTETYTITCYEYIGTTDIPEYPAQTLNIIPKYNTNNSVIEDPAEPWASGVFRWNFFTAPNAPTIPPGSPSLLPRYDNELIRGQLRPNGTRYYSYLRSFEPFPRDAWPVDGGNAYPNSYGGPKRDKIENVKVFKFSPELPEPSIVYHSLDEVPLTAPTVDASSLVIRDASNRNLQTTSTHYGSVLYKNYGMKQWTTYGVNNNLIYNKIYEALVTGNQLPINIISQLSNSTLVYSRSHFATKILPRGTLPTTGTFTATFGGTLDQGIEGYFAEGIPFVDNIDSTLLVYGEGQGLNNFQPISATAQYSVSFIANPQAKKINPPLSLYNWINGDPFTYDTRGDYGNLFVYSVTTGTVFENALIPFDRFYPIELNGDYVKRLGWLSRRIPKGAINFNLTQPNNTATIVGTLVTNTLTNADTQVAQLPVIVEGQTFFVDPQVDLPAPLRFNNNTIRSTNFVAQPRVYNIKSLDFLSASKYTTSTTATVFYPTNFEFVSTDSKINSKNRINVASIGSIWNRGTTVAFTSTNEAYLQTPPEQEYLVYSSALDLEWVFFPQVGYQKILNLGSSSGSGLDPVSYRVRTPTKENDQNLFWYPYWKVERWTTDGSTLLGTKYTLIPFMPPLGSTVPEDKVYNFTGLSGSAREYAIWDSYNDTGIVRPDPPSEPFGPFLFKVYIVLANSSAASNPTQNLVPGSGAFGKITGPLSNGLVRKNAQWVFENFNFVLSTTLNDFSESIIYTNNGVL